MQTILDIRWLVLCRLWMAITQVPTGVLLGITMIGIPLGIAAVKPAAAAIAPQGKDIVSTGAPPYFSRNRWRAPHGVGDRTGRYNPRATPMPAGSLSGFQPSRATAWLNANRSVIPAT
jgi:hypothetical protein